MAIKIKPTLDDDDIDFLGGTVMAMFIDGKIEVEGGTAENLEDLKLMCDEVRLQLVLEEMDERILLILIGLYKIWLKTVALPETDGMLELAQTLQAKLELLASPSKQ